MKPQEQMQEYEELQYVYLSEAEKMFGPKTDYEYLGISYHNFQPRVVLDSKDFLTGQHYYKMELCGMAINDRIDGIFQLSHEVVHLLSPIEQDEGSEVNYLEEGMATYFSKLITERDTGNYEFCIAAIANRPNYLRALKLYESLIAVDEQAVKKLRNITPVIGNIQPEDFLKAGLEVDSNLIESLLEKF